MENLLPKTKLTVELVPRTCWYTNVRSNVSKTEWDRLRKLTAKAAGNRCEICGGRGPKWPVECHEVFEYNDRTGVQRLVRLESLCSACHQVRHIGRTSAMGNGDAARKHLAKVNGWTQEDVEMYLEVVFEVWSRRSQREWTLDISWLKGR